MSLGVTIDQVYQEIKKIREDMVRLEDLEATVDTVEILSNPAAMQAIRKSDQDIRLGRVKTITSFDDILNKCSRWHGPSNGPIHFLKVLIRSGIIKSPCRNLRHPSL